MVGSNNLFVALLRGLGGGFSGYQQGQQNLFQRQLQQQQAGLDQQRFDADQQSRQASQDLQQQEFGFRQQEAADQGKERAQNLALGQIGDVAGQYDNQAPFTPLRAGVLSGSSMPGDQVPLQVPVPGIPLPNGGTMALPGANISPTRLEIAQSQAGPTRVQAGRDQALKLEGLKATEQAARDASRQAARQKIAELQARARSGDVDARNRIAAGNDYLRSGGNPDPEALQSAMELFTARPGEGGGQQPAVSRQPSAGAPAAAPDPNAFGPGFLSGLRTLAPPAAPGSPGPLFLPPAGPKSMAEAMGLASPAAAAGPAAKNLFPNGTAAQARIRQGGVRTEIARDQADVQQQNADTRSQAQEDTDAYRTGMLQVAQDRAAATDAYRKGLLNTAQGRLQVSQYQASLAGVLGGFNAEVKAFTAKQAAGSQAKLQGAYLLHNIDNIQTNLGKLQGDLVAGKSQDPKATYAEIQKQDQALKNLQGRYDQLTGKGKPANAPPSVPAVPQFRAGLPTPSTGPGAGTRSAGTGSKNYGFQNPNAVAAVREALKYSRDEAAVVRKVRSAVAAGQIPGGL